MTLGEAQLIAGRTGWRIDCRPGPDLAALMIGRQVEEVAAMLPRLFNLCRMAQSAAACIALGLPQGDDPGDEVVRDHFARIFVTLRHAFGMAPCVPILRGSSAPRAACRGIRGSLPAGWPPTFLPPNWRGRWCRAFLAGWRSAAR
ncbi:hypothetical protein [Frigidibacter mobilis]|uniref:Hydrogenase expression/formation protein HupK n=1 Tax=Frigidibacter mobilis TaxID=1335048 RepID=A0A159Z3I6_9RHOB|nr:hypothetical protein [Frigidibacter mobilis]AMY68740.1 hydrogenase expression/formation protein HupK [Frigidibacter mobilis]